MDELTLRYRIALGYSSDLPFANRVPGLITCDRPPRALRRTEAEARRDELLDEPVIHVAYRPPTYISPSGCKEHFTEEVFRIIRRIKITAVGPVPTGVKAIRAVCLKSKRSIIMNRPENRPHRGPRRSSVAKIVAKVPIRCNKLSL